MTRNLPAAITALLNDSLSIGIRITVDYELIRCLWEYIKITNFLLWWFNFLWLWIQSSCKWIKLLTNHQLYPCKLKKTQNIFSWQPLECVVGYGSQFVNYKEKIIPLQQVVDAGGGYREWNGDLL